MRPYPHVGFKYHAFMVLHAVHLTTRLVNLARQLVVERNGGYHDYKFAEAAFENASGLIDIAALRFAAVGDRNASVPAQTVIGGGAANTMALRTNRSICRRKSQPISGCESQPEHVDGENDDRRHQASSRA